MKFLKYLGITLLLLILVALIAGYIAHEPLPEGEEGEKAEALAKKMLSAIHKEEYDAIEVLKWNFPRGHSFEWNKISHDVQVKWDNNQVNFNTKTFKGKAFTNGQEVQGNEKQNLIDKAWSLFANDSFWLVAPFKIYDPGTTRKYVNTDRGEGLLITYSSGGVTPGDSYLWLIDETGRPYAWKMWVGIIPVGGIEISWEGWTQHQGAWFAPLHTGPGGYKMQLELF